jgi:hypothetical protein
MIWSQLWLVIEITGFLKAALPGLTGGAAFCIWREVKATYISNLKAPYIGIPL